MNAKDRANLFDVDLEDELSELIHEIQNPPQARLFNAEEPRSLDESDAQVFVGERMECCGGNDSLLND